MISVSSFGFGFSFVFSFFLYATILTRFSTSSVFSRPSLACAANVSKSILTLFLGTFFPHFLAASTTLLSSPSVFSTPSFLYIPSSCSFLTTLSSSAAPFAAPSLRFWIIGDCWGQRNVLEFAASAFCLLVFQETRPLGTNGLAVGLRLGGGTEEGASGHRLVKEGASGRSTVMEGASGRSSVKEGASGQGSVMEGASG